MAREAVYPGKLLADEVEEIGITATEVRSLCRYDRKIALSG